MACEGNRLNSYYLVPLVKRQDLTEPCINLLNQEWPRSRTAREHSMAKSTSEVPPMSFLLLQSGTDILVGHVRLCRLLNEPSGCWIESVIIDSQFRNKGIGRLLMKQIENVAGELGFQKVYLSTKDKQGFYAKCGYHFCDPVVHIGSAKLPVIKGLAEKAFNETTTDDREYSKECQTTGTDSIQNRISVTNHCITASANLSSVKLPPPPPPPAQISRFSKNVAGKDSLSKGSFHETLLIPSQYMSKVLT